MIGLESQRFLQTRLRLFTHPVRHQLSPGTPGSRGRVQVRLAQCKQRILVPHRHILRSSYHAILVVDGGGADVPTALGLLRQTLPTRQLVCVGGVGQVEREKLKI